MGGYELNGAVHRIASHIAQCKVHNRKMPSGHLTAAGAFVEM